MKAVLIVVIVILLVYLVWLSAKFVELEGRVVEMKECMNEIVVAYDKLASAVRGTEFTMFGNITYDSFLAIVKRIDNFGAILQKVMTRI